MNTFLNRIRANVTPIRATAVRFCGEEDGSNSRSLAATLDSAVKRIQSALRLPANRAIEVTTRSRDCIQCAVPAGRLSKSQLVSAVADALEPLAVTAGWWRLEVTETDRGAFVQLHRRRVE